MSRKLAVSIAFILAAACGSKTPTDVERSYAAAQSPHVGRCPNPAGYSPVVSYNFVRGFNVRIASDGIVNWSGSPVNDETLKQFAKEVEEKPQQTAVVVLQSADDADCAVVNRVRSILANSGLCASARCVEVPWELQDTVVN
jgi:biopolymer transport protein ExbD